MSGAESFVPSPLFLTEKAAARIRTLAEAENNPELKLRVYVTGGGCSGFQYGFDFSENMEDDDTIVEKDGVSMLIDPLSYQYLVGSTVDYEEGLAGARFLVHNPNATTTCGCGASFGI
ncbi:Iron-sulfur cluster insertion protein ErpA [Halomonadaceae bacterium LMG 33818]|uniref:iron-sulfur cluster insertion protein ErpA n=1 Tax=Cernens ardua TaxID=3402176 RepID=UPI003EDBC1BC